MRILYLEDDPFQRELAKGWLEAAGHSVQCAGDGAAAIRSIERDSFDLAVLDWQVPAPSGLHVLRWIRQRGLGMPVMFVTSHCDEVDAVTALGSGADDYVAKPVKRPEFLARIAALGRRAGVDREDGRALEVPPYRLDVKTAAIWVSGEPVRLKPREAQLALLLFRKRGEVISRNEIVETVWGKREQLASRTVDTHMSRVRKLLRLDGSLGWKLEAVYLRGYRLAEACDDRPRPWSPAADTTALGRAWNTRRRN